MSNPTPGAPVPLPSSKLRNRWLDEAPDHTIYDYLIDQATAWGADEQLRLCMEWLLQRPVTAPAYCLALEMQSALRPDGPAHLPPDAIKENTND